MAYFPDLSPYRYDENYQPGVVHVGWVGEGQPFPKGVVAPHIVAKLKALATHPVEVYRGTHTCEICERPDDLPMIGDTSHPRYAEFKEWEKTRSSNGEIRVTKDGVTFAAPILIVHYIEAHGYLPPTEFLNAVEMHRME